MKIQQKPTGTVSVHEVLGYLDSDRYLNKREAASYTSLSVRLLESRLDEIPHFRVGRKVLFKRSELDTWMEGHREGGTADQDRMVDEVLQKVLTDAS